MKSLEDKQVPYNDKVVWDNFEQRYISLSEYPISHFRAVAAYPLAALSTCTLAVSLLLLYSSNFAVCFYLPLALSVVLLACSVYAISYRVKP